jgi:hypothetical protein
VTGRHIHWTSCFGLWLLVLLLVLFPAASRAEYDQEAEIGRLIERATTEKRDVTAGLAGLRATREKLKQQFLFINDTEQQLAGNLQRIRAIDARNKAMLVISTGLNITAVNAPEKLAEAATSVVVDVASEFLRNNYPALFDSSVTVVLPKLGLEGVAAMRAFNTTMALTDAAIEQRIFAEDPAFAQDVANRGWLQKTLSGDKLSDQLIALKRAQFQIRDGTLAEQALEQLKRELLARQALILQAIAALEQEEQRLEETIQSWGRHLDGVRVASAVPPVPQAGPVVLPTGPMPDFGAAAAAMQDALARLKSNQVDCNGYESLVWAASWNADQLFQHLWMGQVRDVCWSNGWSSDACKDATQRFDATIRSDYEARIGGAQRSLTEQFSAERPVADRFMASLRGWQAQKITVPDFGAGTRTTFQPTSGDEAAAAVWSGSEIALPPSYLDDYEMQVVRGGPPLLAQINQALAAVIAHARELDNDLAVVQAADNQTRSLAEVAGELARQWEPRLYFWSCVAGTRHWDDQRWLRMLKAFPTVYPAHAETGRQAAKRYRDAVQVRQALLVSLASAYRDEAAIVRARVEAEDLRMRLLETGRETGVSLRSPDVAYSLWHMMTNAGVTQAMVKELAEVNPQLGNEVFVLEYVVGLQANHDPRRRPVLTDAALVRLRAELSAAAARVVPAYNDYQSLYAQLRRKQSEIDSRYRALRSAVEAALGEPAEYLAPPQILDARYLMDAADLPDPTAGVFEQLDAYEKLARDYHARIDPLHPASFPLVGPMDALVLKLQQGRGGLMGLEEPAFLQQLSAFMSDSEKLTALAVQAGGTMGPAALFAKARARLMRLHGDISSAYFQGRAVGEVTRQLGQLVADVGGFLASPPAAGGVSVAQDWVLRVDEALAPAGRAYSLRSDGGIASLMERLGALRARLASYQESSGDALVRKLYQDFATAYQARNLRGVLRFMTPDWRASDGSDLRDLEDILDNSFRVFNSIVFAMSGLSITPAGDGRFTVRYAATITGRINQMNLNHQETAQVEDTVILTPAGPRILASHGGRIWLKR